MEDSNQEGSKVVSIDDSTNGSTVPMLPTMHATVSGSDVKSSPSDAMIRQKSIGQLLKEKDAVSRNNSGKSGNSKDGSEKKQARLESPAVGFETDFAEKDTRKSRMSECQSVRSGMTLYSLRDDKDDWTSINLTDKYAIAESLGKGGFGEVFLVTSLITKQNLAAKSMPAESSQMFQNEFAIARKLKHPNIVKLYDMCHLDGTCYLVFELCKGGDLFGFVDSRDEMVMYTRVYMPPPTRVLAKFSWQMLQTLYYLHGHKIVHRDIKLENFLLTSQEEGQADIKLIDFGFATKVQKGVLLTELLGTAGYMAPEVLSLKGYDLKCDTWSVGVCIYIIFAGKHPIHIEDSKAAKREEMYNLTMDTAIDYKFFSENYPKAVQAFVKELLEKDPEKRTSPKVLLKTNEWLRTVGRGKSIGCCSVQ